MAKKILLALAILLATIIFTGNVFAFSDEDVTVYGSVYLKGEKTIPISISNYSAAEKELNIDFIGTTKLGYEFENVPETLKANKKATVKLKLTPLSDSLVGKAYKCTLVVHLGNEMVRKEITVTFLKNDEASVVFEGAEEKGNEEGNGSPTGKSPFGPTSTELVINIILAAVAIVLAVMLIIKIKDKQ